METRYARLIFIFLFLFSSLKTFAVPASFHVELVDRNLESALIMKKIWHYGCPVGLNELRVLSVNYWDFLGRPRQGKIILHQSVANAALSVFQKLYSIRFPFSKIDTLLTFDGDWQKAEENNVTYGFICRQDKNNFTLESLGKTITVNPVLNPEFSMEEIAEKKMTENNGFIWKFLKKFKHMFASGTSTDDEIWQRVKISPKSGIFAINRGLKLRGMTEVVESIFAAQGFIRANIEKQMNWKKFVFAQKENKNIGSGPFLMAVNDKSTPELVFNYKALPDKLREQLKKNNLWHKDCPISLDRLNLIYFSYLDFNGNTQIGQIVVFDALAPYLTMAFKELYALKFPLETPELDGTGKNTDQSSIAFICRSLTGSSTLPSLHSYGLAVDINVFHNPYLGSFSLDDSGNFVGLFIPFNIVSFNHLNRAQIRPGMNEGIVNIMKKYGLIEWGGTWEDRVDYMHFQVPKNLAVNLAYLDVNSGKKLLDLSIKYPEAAKKMSDDQRWQYLYRLYPTKYMQVLSKYFLQLQSQNEFQVINQVYMDLLNGV